MKAWQLTGGYEPLRRIERENLRPGHMTSGLRGNCAGRPPLKPCCTGHLIIGTSSSLETVKHIVGQHDN